MHCDSTPRLSCSNIRIIVDLDRGMGVGYHCHRLARLPARELLYQRFVLS